MNIQANIFDNLYPFLVIIFFVISIISSIMKKKTREAAQKATQQYVEEEEYPQEEYQINNVNDVKPQYDYYKTSANTYNAENNLNKFQDKTSNPDKQKSPKHKKTEHLNIPTKQTSTETEPILNAEELDLLNTYKTNITQNYSSGFDKIDELPYLQKAVILSEVFGQPKGLE